MNTRDFVKQELPKYLNDFDVFLKSVEKEDYISFKSSINSMVNMVTKLMYIFDPEAQIKTLYEVSQHLESLDEDILALHVHYMRKLRNNYIHDLDKTNKIHKVMMQFTQFIVEDIVSFVADGVGIEIEESEILFIDRSIKEPQVDETDIDYNFRTYTQHIRPNISTDILDFFEPNLDELEVNSKDVRIIFEYIFLKMDFEEVKDKYSLSGKEFNNLLTRYGFEWDFQEFLQLKIRTVENFKYFLNDFDSEKKLTDQENIRKIKFLTKYLDLSEEI